MQLEGRFVPRIHGEQQLFSSVMRNRSSVMDSSKTVFTKARGEVVDAATVLVVSVSTAGGGDSGGDGVVIMQDNGRDFCDERPIAPRRRVMCDSIRLTHFKTPGSKYMVMSYAIVHTRSTIVLRRGSE